MKTVGDFQKRLRQSYAIRIAAASVALAFVDWRFGVAVGLGLVAAGLLVKVWRSNRPLHDRIFAPIFLILLAAGPLKWGFEWGSVVTGGKPNMAAAYAGMVAMIGIVGASFGLDQSKDRE